MRSRLLAVVSSAALLVGMTACGSATAGKGSAAPTPVTTTEVSAAPVPSAAEPSPAAPTLRGNAATNPACKLLSIDQVVAHAGLPVTAVLGVVGNADAHSELCTWYLDSKIIQASLVVQYRLYTQPPNDVTAYYKQVIAQKYAKEVPHLGTIAKIAGHTIDVVYERASISVALLTHAEATVEDQAATIAITRLVMSGIRQ